MKIKTRALTGRALNWVVRYALNGRPPAGYVEDRDNFSTCWNKCGPLIERVGVSVQGGGIGGWVAALHWSTKAPGDTQKSYHIHNGPTPLTAICRCIASSKLGHEVDIPEELL